MHTHKICCSKPTIVRISIRKKSPAGPLFVCLFVCCWRCSESPLSLLLSTGPSTLGDQQPASQRASQQLPPCLLEIPGLDRLFLVTGFQNFPCGAVVSSPPWSLALARQLLATLGHGGKLRPLNPLASKPPLIRGSLLVLGAQCITPSSSLSVKNFWPPPPFKSFRLGRRGARVVYPNVRTTLSNGYLGSCNDEERSEMRYLV